MSCPSRHDSLGHDTIEAVLASNKEKFGSVVSETFSKVLNRCLGTLLERI